MFDLYLFISYCAGSVICLSCTAVAILIYLLTLIYSYLRALSDVDSDGRLSAEEFSIAMFLVDNVKMGHPLPNVLPPNLIPPSLRSRSRSNSGALGLPVSSAGGFGLSQQPQQMDSFGDLVPGGFGGKSFSNEPSEPPPSLPAPTLPLTLEDKRRENFAKGNAELERRRAELREQQRQEEEARIAKERAEQEKREAARREQERKKQMEHERMMEKQRQMEMEREEQRRKAIEVVYDLT